MGSAADGRRPAGHRARRGGSGGGAIQDNKDAEYAAEMRGGETALTRRLFEPALKSFKRAHSLKDKKSLEALHGMARAYHGLSALRTRSSRATTP